MLRRALICAPGALRPGYFAAPEARAQAQNLEAGKSPSQIFAGTCTACHKSPRGLLKTVPAGSLQSFLRQHYTTSPEMASLLTSFLISNGATDTRYVGTQPKAGADAKLEARPGGPPDQLDRFGHRVRPAAATQEAARPEPAPHEAAKPDPDGLPPQGDGRHGHNAKRLARPGEAPDATKPAADGQAPVQAASEPRPHGRKLSAKQRLSNPGRPRGEEPPQTASPKTEGPSKGEAAKDDKPNSEAAKDEGGKPEGTKPTGEGKSEAAKSESAKSESAKSESAKIELPKETGGSTPVL